MREMLEPIFGENGAVVAQFIITLAVVLALVVVVVWLVRRYAAGGLGTTIRGRLPRLAVIDAMAVDNRRKLVLVRRDNVEHLLLIGGPADLVVEPGIVRTRTQAQRGATAPTAQRPQPSPPPEAPVAEPARPVAEPVPAPAAEAPIPFPPRRIERPIMRRDLPRAVPAPSEPVASPPARLARAAPVAVETLADEEESRTTPFFSPIPEPAEEPFTEATEFTTESSSDPLSAEASGPDELDLPPFLSPSPQSEPESPELPSTEAPAMAADSGPPAPDAEAPAPSTAARVNDLEREMARLLGEISSRRTS